MTPGQKFKKTSRQNNNAVLEFFWSASLLQVDWRFFCTVFSYTPLLSFPRRRESIFALFMNYVSIAQLPKKISTFLNNYCSPHALYL